MQDRVGPMSNGRGPESLPPNNFFYAWPPQCSYFYPPPPHDHYFYHVPPANAYGNYAPRNPYPRWVSYPHYGRNFGHNGNNYAALQLGDGWGHNGSFIHHSRIPERAPSSPTHVRDPTPAPPCPNFFDKSRPLSERIATQIEFYFSDENLATDYYLRSCMDNQGWVPISTMITTFFRIMQVTKDVEMVSKSLKDHSTGVLEIQDGKVRKRVGWMKYVTKPTDQSSPVAELGGAGPTISEASSERSI